MGLYVMEGHTFIFELLSVYGSCALLKMEKNSRGITKVFGMLSPNLASILGFIWISVPVDSLTKLSLFPSGF